MKRIFNETKDRILNPSEIDLKKGYLVDDFISHHVEEKEEIPDEGHYEVIAEYDNGGKDLQWVIDKVGQRYCPAHDETEEIQIYILYTDDQLKALGLYEWSEEELLKIRKDEWETKRYGKIEQWKNELNKTDYHVIKYLEGVCEEDDFLFWKSIRQNFRDNIQELRALTFEKDEDKLEELLQKGKID